ncbi:MAG: phosphate/phosphite/phosphonate ABC transporter substrate-binding protein [Desulfovibrionales bacterium]
MNARVLLWMVLGLLLLPAGCGDGEEVVVVDMDRREEIVLPSPDHAVTYAYLPQYSHTTSFERHRLLIEYLRKTTGIPLRQVFPDTFEEHVRMVERGEIDISYSNPFIYIRMADMGARAFAKVVEQAGKPTFRGQIICRADNPQIRTLQDCTGKRWMAVDPSSAGGYLFPLGHFVENGITKEDFAEIAFAPGPGGKQEKVVLAVYAGTYDVGSIREGTLELLRGRIDLDQIRILAESRPYPGWVFAARQGLDPTIEERLATAMFALDPELKLDSEILNRMNVQDIIPAADQDYDLVRDLASRLGTFIIQD